MPLSSVWDLFEREVFPCLSSDDDNHPTFNPYKETDPELDVGYAVHIRRANLRNYLRSFPLKPAILVVGEAPGWRGCRFSGVPFTSEAQLVSETLPFSGSASSRRMLPYREATATIFWETMQAYHPDFFAWNCIPLHPHRARDRLSNRTPSEYEIQKFLPLLSQLMNTLNPSLVIAVGKRSESALSDTGFHTVAVRHPSHGGAKEFRQGIECALGKEY
jgi:uracil-DNA glycosylase